MIKTIPSLPISSLVLTYNEEQVIHRCLKSLVWSDEILVVDACSTDQTEKICKDSQQPWAGKLRWIQRPWTGFRDQRTFAMQQANTDWLLIVDADEECSSELSQKIGALLKLPGGPPSKAYQIRRIEYFLGKQIHYGIWNPSYQDRFFNRLGVRYVNEIHEYPVFLERAQQIHEPLMHSPHFSPVKFIDKMNRYTTIEAQDRVSKGQRTNGFRIFFAFPAMFLKNYFYYGAYRDGFHGFIISLLEGISRVIRHIKIWQYSRLDKK